MQANFFNETWKIPGPCMETFCNIAMQPSLFELKLKTFPLLRRSDHIVFTPKFLMKVPYVITVTQIAHGIAHYFETYNETEVYLL